MSKDVNNLFDFIDGAKEAKNQETNQTPIRLYSLRKAMDFEKQLRDIIIDTRGMKGWAKFQQMRKQSKEAERKSRYAQMARRNKIMNILSIILGLSLFVGGAYALIWFAMEFSK